MIKRNQWSQSEGGTGAAPGRKGYSVRTPLGQYSISPVCHKNSNRHKGYRLVYFSQAGLNRLPGYPQGLCVDIGPDGSGIGFTASGTITLPEAFKRASLHEAKYTKTPLKEAA